MKKSHIRHLFLVISMLALASCFTGCETVKNTLYEPVPYDEVAIERGITLEEAEALGVVRPNSSIAPLIDAVGAVATVPGVRPIASTVLNGALAIGALWFAKRKRTADKVSASLSQGIDTCRDVLDQTPHGEKIDARLTETLREHQNALQVQKEITKLLERFATPTKKPIQLDA